MAGQRARATVDVDSAAFDAALKTAVGKLKLNSERDLLVLGTLVQNKARTYCPVDTGRLRSSINASKGSDSRGPYVEVGTNVEYAAHVEFGTSRAAAQPYLRPALLEGVQQAGRILGGR